MRLIPLSFLFVLCVGAAAQAQSVLDEMPPMIQQNEPQTGGDVSPPLPSPAQAPQTESYTVADVNADVTADRSGHARDQALTQAERTAFMQLCARLGIAAEHVAKFSDDDIAALVQSFDLQSERLSAVRYIGVFTIHFKPAAMQKKIGRYLPVAGIVASNASLNGVKSLPSGALSHMPVTVQTPTLAVWTKIQRSLNAVPQVAKVDVISMGRGASHVDLSYGGSVGDLQQAVTGQGLVLQQTSLGDWVLSDNSMTMR